MKTGKKEEINGNMFVISSVARFAHVLMLRYTVFSSLFHLKIALYIGYDSTVLITNDD